MFISEALAQTPAPATGAAPGGASSMIVQLLPMILIVAIFYLLLIRPQQKRAKEHQAMIAAVRRGDTVVTSGGIIGKVAKVDDATVTVEIADNVKISVVKSSLSEVRTKGEPVRTDDEKPAGA